MLNDGSGNINVPSLTIRGGADGKKGVTVASAGEYKLSIDASAGIFLNGPIVGNNNFYLKSKADESVYIYCDSDATDKKKCNIICDLTYITGKTNSQGLLTAQNGINLKNSMVCNDNTIFFRPNLSDGTHDYYHGINYNGTFDGPFLYGHNGGALGLRPKDGFKTVLVWNHEKNVTMKGSLTVDGTAVMQAPVIVNGTLTTKSGIDSHGGVIRAHGGLHAVGLQLHGNMGCRSLPILFGNDDDYNHGINYHGGYNGPALYGQNGGALGTGPKDSFKPYLQWRNDGYVFLHYKLAFADNYFEIFAKNNHLLINNTTSSRMNFLVGYKDLNIESSAVDCYFNGNIRWRFSDKYSDYRLKKNIKDIGNITTLNLRPVVYDMKSGEQDHCLGFIAHEVQEIIPCVVSGEKDGEKMQAISYESIIPVLVKDFQRMHKTITEQESRIAKLESQISYLMNRLA